MSKQIDRARPAPRVTVQMQSRITPELKERLTKAAMRRGVHEVRLVEEALEKLLAGEQ